MTKQQKIAKNFCARTTIHLMQNMRLIIPHSSAPVKSQNLLTFTSKSSII